MIGGVYSRLPRPSVGDLLLWNLPVLPQQFGVLVGEGPDCRGAYSYRADQHGCLDHGAISLNMAALGTR